MTLLNSLLSNTEGSDISGIAPINFDINSGGISLNYGSGLAVVGGQLVTTDAGGTVTNVSGVAANGFTWSITNPTTTPAITLTLSDARILSTAPNVTMVGENYGSINSATQVLTLSSVNLAGTNVTGVLPNTKINASSTNAASTVALRDGSGNFAAGTITAALSGNATTSTTTSNISGGLLGSLPYQSAVNTTALLAGNTTTTKQYLSQTGNGTVSAAPAWATISGVDITGAALTKTDDTNVTLTLGGTPTTSLLRAASLTLGWAGQLAMLRGGSNAPLIASNGGITYSTASALAIGPVGTSGQILTSGGAGVYTWSPTASANTPSTIVLRDGSGNFAAGTITATLSGNATTATTSSNLAGGAAGSIPYQSAANTTTFLASAGSNRILTFTTTPIWSAYPALGGLTLNNLGNPSGAGLSPILYFDSALADGDYIGLGGSGRNIGVTNTGAHFLSYGLDWENLSFLNTYIYPLSSTPAAAIEISSGFAVKTAPGGTLNDQAITTTVFSVSNTGAVVATGAISASNLSGTNTGNVTLAGENYLSIASQTITANAVNLSNTNTTGILTIAKGGNNIGSQTTNGILFNNGTANTSNSAFTFDGSTTVTLTGTGGYNNIIVESTASSGASQGALALKRGHASTGSYAQVHFYTTTVDDWSIGLRQNDTNLHFFDAVNNTDRMVISQAGVVSLSANVASSSTTTGTLVVAGGGGFSGNINAAGTVLGSNLSGTNTGNVTLAGENYLTIAAQVITANAVNLAGTNVTGTLTTTKGGSGTGTTFTAGSVIFAGTSGIYNQDNTNLFWDNTNKKLAVCVTSPLSAYNTVSFQVGPTSADISTYNPSLSSVVITSKTNNGGNSPTTPEPVVVWMRQGIGAQSYANIVDWKLSRGAGFVGNNANTVFTLGLTGSSLQATTYPVMTWQSLDTVITTTNFGSFIVNSGTASASGSGDFTNVTNPAVKISTTAASNSNRIVYLSTDSVNSTIYNYETGKSVYWGELTDTGSYIFRGRTVNVPNFIATTMAGATLSLSSGAAGTVQTLLTLKSPRSFAAAALDGTLIVATPSNGTLGTHDYGAILMGNNQAVNDGGAGRFELRVGGSSSSTANNGLFLRSLSTASNAVSDVSIYIAATQSFQVDSSKDVNVLAGNLSVQTAGKGFLLRGATVSAGTANAAFVFSVVLVAGTATISNSFITVNCAAGEPTVVTAGGTPGVGYKVSVTAGSFTITSTNVLDTSTLNIAFFKGI